MKKLLYLGIVLMLASCGPKIEEGFATIQGVGLVTIKIGDLEVMTEDLARMNWKDAKKACADLGDGWRLPTKDELNILYQNKDSIILYQNKDSIDGFAGCYYWSSTEVDNFNVWKQDFGNEFQYGYSKFSTGYVRAVRSI